MARALGRCSMWSAFLPCKSCRHQCSFASLAGDLTLNPSAFPRASRALQPTVSRSKCHVIDTRATLQQRASPSSLSSAPPPHFSDLPLDRAAHLRRDTAALQDLLHDPTSRTIVFCGRKALVAPLPIPAAASDANVCAGDPLAEKTERQHDDISTSRASGGVNPKTKVSPFPRACSLDDRNNAALSTPDGGKPIWVPLLWPLHHPDMIAATVNDDVGFLFLGLTSKGGAVFACQVAEVPGCLRLIHDPTTFEHSNECENGSMNNGGANDTMDETAVSPAGQSHRGNGITAAALVDVRSQGQRMTGGDAAALALASGLLSWHVAAAFCGKTGRSMTSEAGGHARRAVTAVSSREGDTKRERAVYPRVDPAVIVAVTLGDDWLLLGRKKSWDKGRYSLLAGFLEVGETLEAAAAREVFEESGVVVDPESLQYHSSQPWPFPQSLMVGFIAHAACKTSTNANVARTTTAGKVFDDVYDPISSSKARVSTATSRRRLHQGFDILSDQGRRVAREVGVLAAEVDAYAGHAALPDVTVDPDELEDARWFHRDWLAARVLDDTSSQGRSTIKGLSRVAPPLGAVFRGAAADGEPPFRIPGKYTLANRIITDWLLRRGAARSNNNNVVDSINASLTTENDMHATKLLQLLPEVGIDQGTFKYVLLRVTSPDGALSKLIVRGDSRAPYHNDIFRAARSEAAKIDRGLYLETLGGGRIEHDVQKRSVLIYGYSAAFGQAPHEVTAGIVRAALPFHAVSLSYEGY